jgi:hypothetical protein
MLALTKRKIRCSINRSIEHLLDAPETSNLRDIHLLLDVWFAVVDVASRGRGIFDLLSWARHTYTAAAVYHLSRLKFKEMRHGMETHDNSSSRWLGVPGHGLVRL